MFRVKTWWLRAWTYARIQILCLTGLTFVAGLFLFNLQSVWGTSIAIGAAIISALCLRDILPFTPLGKKQVSNIPQSKNNKAVKLFVGNVLMDNQSHQPLLDMIDETAPDIVFLVETDQRWRDYMAALEDKFAHTYLLPLPDYNGMLFYSRFPILDVRERYLVQDHIPSLTLTLDLGDGEILTFYGLHPRPPRPQDDTADLDKELEIVAKEVSQIKTPVIVTGDLNDVGWSTTTKAFLKTSNLKDPRRGRGLYNSYNAKIPVVRWPLDHTFHSDHFGLLSLKRMPAFGSDHFPIFIELGLET